MYTLLALTIRPERVPRGRSRRRQDALCARRARVRLSYRRCLQQGFAPFGASRLLPGMNRYSHPTTGTTRNRAASVGGCVLIVSVLAWLSHSVARGSNTRCGQSHESSNDVDTLRPMPDKLNRGPPVFLLGGNAVKRQGNPRCWGYPAFSRTANSIARYWSSRALLSSSFSLM